MKAGYKTTEFWLTVGLFVADFIQAVPAPGWAKALAVGLYAISRGYQKRIT